MKKLTVIFSILMLVGVFSSCQRQAEQEAPKVEVEAAVDTSVVDTMKADTPPPPVQ